MNRRVGPGDIIVETWRCTKGRPWLVLWVDDKAGEVCVAAATNQKDYVGAVDTGLPAIPTVGAFVMIQPLHKANAAKKIGHINRADRDAVRKQLREHLDLE